MLLQAQAAHPTLPAGAAPPHIRMLSRTLARRGGLEHHRLPSSPARAVLLASGLPLGTGGKAPACGAAMHSKLPLAPRRRSSAAATHLSQATTQMAPAAPQDLATADRFEQLQAEGEGMPTTTFDWHRQWYPLFVADDLDPSIPHAAKLLGMDLVVWKDKAGVWRCFQDRCPHRLAALSEGRLDHRSGDLFCNYHGWSFDGSGACTNIPQLGAEQQPKRLSPRACAVRFPTRLAEGLVWVWASPGSDAFAEAAAAEWRGLASFVDEDQARGGRKTSWYMRVVHGSYAAAKENYFNDPSHDAVLHHGCSSFLHRDKAVPLTAEVKDMSPTGYTVRLALQASKPPEAVAAGPPPVMDVCKFPVGSSRIVGTKPLGVTYSVPTGPHLTTMFLAFPAASQPPGNVLQRLQGLAKEKMPWMDHLGLHMLVDTDIAIQDGVTRNRAKDPSAVFLPAEADRGPAAFWAWMRKYGGGGPPLCQKPQPLVDVTLPEVPRRVLLDRYEQHTRHCKSCREAHATLTQLSRLAQLLAAAFSVALIAAVVGQGLMVRSAVLALGAAAAVWAHRQLSVLVAKFEFLDYDSQHPGKRP